MASTTMQIRALPDGPYRLDGAAAIVDRDGQAVAGSHARTGWKDDA